MKKQNTKLLIKTLEEKRYKSKEDRIELDYAKKGLTISPLELRYLKKGIRWQIVWDIETSDFNPLGNFIIGYCAIIRDILGQKKLQYFEDNITKADIQRGVDHDAFSFDYRILQTLSKVLRKADQAVGHYSTKFDMPYFRTRCMLTKQEDLIPQYGELKQGDTWRMMKFSMKAPRNTLANFALYTNTPNLKTYVDMEHWKRIYFPANPKWAKSMHYIMDHCRKDVKMDLKGLYKAEKFNNVSAVLV